MGPYGKRFIGGVRVFMRSLTRNRILDTVDMMEKNVES